MKFAITYGQLNPRFWVGASIEADRAGFESAWCAEHLVLPVEMRGQLVPGEEHPPIPASTPVFDAPAYLSFIAGQTSRIRLGTFVYLLGLRHPFVGARAFATLDCVSQGRAEIGIGAGWLTTEWDALGLDPRSRGRRLDECVAVCKRLWTEDVIEHQGEFYRFPPVMFEPKPVQKPHPPISVGGESRRALRRAATLDGWIGMGHTPESAARQVALLRQLEREAGRTGPPVTVTVMGGCESREDVARWVDAGVDRLIVVPWRRSSEAVDAIRRFADALIS
jgi:probable F420-dependent oxidoreductase